MELYLLNRLGELLTIVHNDSELDGTLDFNLVEDLAETDTLEFEVSGGIDGIEHIIEGNYILVNNFAKKKKLFVIKRVTDNHGQVVTKSIYCEEFLTELGDYVVGTNYSGKEFNPVTELPKLLEGTGITAGTIEAPHINPTITEDTRYISKMALLNSIVENTEMVLLTEIELSQNKIAKKIIHLKERNKAEGKRFEFDSELTSISREIDASEVRTAIYPLGKSLEQTQEDRDAGKPLEYITIKDVSWSTSAGKPLNKPAGSEVLVDPEATAKYGNKQADGGMAPKVIVVQFSDIEDPEQLALAAYAELKKLAEPKVNFTFTANEISKQLQGAGLTEEPVEVGDVCYVIDNSVVPPIVDEVVVRRLAGNPELPETMEIEIGTPQETLVDNTVQSQVMNTLNSSGVLNNSGVFTDITALKADIKDLKASKAEIADLEAITIKTETIQSEIGTINNLLSGNITSDNIQSGGITSDKLTIADAFIKDAMIESLSLSKLKAGQIDTGKISIGSADGGITIADNTQQFRDKAGKVRIQMGQDAKGNFSFGIFDSTGTGTLIDHTGIKEKAIADGLIKEKMIGDGEIGGQKINIESMVSKLNSDTNTTLIKGSKVLLDTEGQTLEVSFKKMQTASAANREDIDLINAKKMYRAVIESTNGNVFKNGNIDTTLNAKLYSWDTDVTATTDASRFKWTRVSSDTAGDTAWNANHAAGTKSIRVTKQDVTVRATFKVRVLDEQGNVIAE